MTTMTIVDALLFLTNLVISAINCFLMWHLLERLKIIHRKFHVSFFVVRTLHIGCCFCISLTLFPTCLTLFFNLESDYWQLPPLSFIIYRIGAIALSSVAITLRFITIGLFLERSIATCYHRKYENARFSGFVGPMIGVFGILISAIIAAAYHSKYLPFNYYVGTVVAIDCSGFVVLWLLLCSNKKMRRITNQSQINLSERYQINENLRVLLLLRPIVAIENLVNIVASFSGPVMLALTGIPLYRDFAYYTVSFDCPNQLRSVFQLMNVNVLVVFLLTIKSHPIQTAEDVTSSVNSDKSHKMVNVFGDEIVQNPGQQEYFQMLKKEWS